MLAAVLGSCTTSSSTPESGHRLPDWALGGFERPEGVNPVISPRTDTKFYCPMRKDSVAWESNDTFNPAATIGCIFSARNLRCFIRQKMHKKNWNGLVGVKIREWQLQKTDYM